MNDGERMEIKTKLRMLFAVAVVGLLLLTLTAAR